MSTKTQYVNRDGDDSPVYFHKKDDGWYVMTVENKKFWLFATPEASERDVRQLIRKKWCEDYTVDPDPLYKT